jgi:hypothetical protein
MLIVTSMTDAFCCLVLSVRVAAAARRQTLAARRSN